MNMEASVRNPGHPTPQMGRSLISYLWTSAAVVVLAIVISLLVGFAVLLSREPKSGRTMKFLSRVSIPATHTLISATDYATFHDGSLYVAYGSADELLAVDPRNGTVREFASGLTGIHGVAFSDASRMAYASLGGKNAIAAIEVAHPSSWTAVPAGQDTDGIVFDNHDNMAYAGNNGGGTATLVPDAKPLQSISIPLGGAPEFPQVDENTGLVYQPLEDTNEVVVVSPLAKRVVSRFALAPCKNPHGSAIDPEGKVLFVGCSNRLLAVMDLKTGTIIATVPIGRFVDTIAWDGGLHRVYTANSAGTMTVVEESSPRVYRVIDTVQTAAGGHTLAVDLYSHKVYVVCSRIRGAQVLVFEPLPDPSAFVP